MMLLWRLLLLARWRHGAACGARRRDPARGPSAAPATAADRGWERVVPGGDCQCSDGSEFSFWVRKANRRRLFIQSAATFARLLAVRCVTCDGHETHRRFVCG